MEELSQSDAGSIVCLILVEPRSTLKVFVQIV